MTFGIYYLITPPKFDIFVHKATDENKKDIRLSDDKKNQYLFLQAKGCAVRAKLKAASCDGWFLFPPAKPDAKSFIFHYPISGTDYKIEDIVLLNPKK